MEDNQDLKQKKIIQLSMYIDNTLYRTKQYWEKKQLKSEPKVRFHLNIPSNLCNRGFVSDPISNKKSRSC